MGFRGWTNSKSAYTDEKGALVTSGAHIHAASRISLTDVSEPPDDALQPSELALWLDPTPGATKLMIKAKDAGGAVRAASLDLS